MKFKLDCKENFEKSMLFWLCRFIKFKLSSLSNTNLSDQSTLAHANSALFQGVNSIDELDSLVKNARNAGIGGINTYFNPLKKIFELLCVYELESLKQIDEELISEILASATGALSDASKKNYRISAINFFSFLDKQNEENGKAHIFDITLKNWGGVSGNSGAKLPEFMSEDEVKAFLEAIDKSDFKSNTARNRCVIKLILFTGIRVSEALSVRRKDITEQDDLFVIRIRGKGNKYRVVMIKKHLIAEYLPQIPIHYDNKDGFLFINAKGGRLTQAYVSRIVEKILFSAGIRKEKNGAHMLRHTFATMLYKNQKDLVLVQEALGHASLNTSRIYTHFDSDKLRLAAQVAENLSEK